MNRKLIRPDLEDLQQRRRSSLTTPKYLQKRRAESADQTSAEANYYLKQMANQTRMVIVLKDGDRIRGTIEWYDRAALKVHQQNGPNILLMKDSVKYMYKEEDERQPELARARRSRGSIASAPCLLPNFGVLVLCILAARRVGGRSPVCRVRVVERRRGRVSQGHREFEALGARARPRSVAVPSIAYAEILVELTREKFKIRDDRTAVQESADRAAAGRPGSRASPRPDGLDAGSRPHGRAMVTAPLHEVLPCRHRLGARSLAGTPSFWPVRRTEASDVR